MIFKTTSERQKVKINEKKSHVSIQARDVIKDFLLYNLCEKNIN